jgi:DNA-directed RNA polymerase specialized sigma24 family protein
MPAPTEHYNPSDEQHCHDLTREGSAHQDAWSRLYTQVKSYGFQFMPQFGEDVVKDLIQDSLLLFQEQIRERKFVCRTAKPSTYVIEILKRKLYTKSRKVSKQEALHADTQDQSALLETDDDLSLDCARKAVKQALADQDPQFQELVWSYWVEDMTLKAYELLKGGAPRTASQTLHRKLPAFRRSFFRYFSICMER